MLPNRHTTDAGGSTIHVLTGCTASGKTSAALTWAEAHGAEIVSCDALLFYRGMDIGTAKPTAAERARVPHHLVDVCGVAQRMDVKSYVQQARKAVADIFARGRNVLVVGGSGFYLRSFFAPVADDVEVDPRLRAELEAELAARGLPALVQRLEGLNPAGIGTLDVRNPRRVVRALERCLSSGATLADLREGFGRQSPPFADYTVRMVELAREPADLRHRIATRVEQMLVTGLIEEVHALRSAGLESNPSAARAIGYRETMAWLDAGGGDRGELSATISANTWKLVRKQRTWFRTQLPEHRVITVPPGGDAEAMQLFSA